MYWKFKLPIVFFLFAILVLLFYTSYRTFRIQGETQTETRSEPLQTDPAAPETAPEPARITDTPDSSPAQPLPDPETFTVREITENTEPPKPEPLKAEPPKPEPAKTEPAKPEPPKPEPTKPEPAKPEPPKPEPAKPEPPKPEPAKAEPPKPEPARSVADAATEQLLREADALKETAPLRARELAEKALDALAPHEFSPDWRRAAQIISDINRMFMTTPAPCPEKQTYTIAEGDRLVRIAYRLKTTAQAIMAINANLDARRLWVGRKIAYLDGTWSIKVSKSNFILVLYRNGKLSRIYPVGIGRDNRTPVGTFKIDNKVVNPAWDSPTGRIPPSDPRNILGTRWMGLLAIDGTSPYLTGYGIHGTTLPDTVGTPSSAGCVRLKNEEINDLYNIIPDPQAAETRVIIQE